MSKLGYFAAGGAGLAAMVAVTVCLRVDFIEQDLGTRAQKRLSQHGFSEIATRVDGRDLTLSGKVASEARRAWALELVGDIWGARIVKDDLITDASLLQPPADETLQAASDATDEPTPEVEIPSAVIDLNQVHKLTPPDHPVLVAADCQLALDTLTSETKVGFESGSPTPSAESYELLNGLATVLNNCEPKTVEIAGHTDDTGSDALNARLSEARAETVKTVFTHAGINPELLTTIGHGASQPVADNDSPEGRAANRRITFRLLD